MKNMMQSATVKKLVLVGCAVAAFGLAACETVKGAGKDVQYAGEKTQEALQKAGAPK